MIERIDTGVRSSKIVKHNGVPISLAKSTKATPFKSKPKSAYAVWKNC